MARQICRLERLLTLYVRLTPAPWILDLAIPAGLFWLFSDQRWSTAVRSVLRWGAERVDWLAASGALIFLVAIVALAVPLIMFSRRPLRFALTASAALAALAIDLWGLGIICWPGSAHFLASTACTR